MSRGRSINVCETQYALTAKWKLWPEIFGSFKRSNITDFAASMFLKIKVTWAARIRKKIHDSADFTWPHYYFFFFLPPSYQLWVQHYTQKPSWKYRPKISLLSCEQSIRSYFWQLWPPTLFRGIERRGEKASNLMLWCKCIPSFIYLFTSVQYDQSTSYISVPVRFFCEDLNYQRDICELQSVGQFGDTNTV